MQHTSCPQTPPSRARYSPQRNDSCLAEDDHYLGRRVSIVVISLNDHNPGWVTLPKSLRAPNRYLLKKVVNQTGTPILTTSIHLTILVLERIPTSTHIPPEYLIDLLELMPQFLILSVSSRLPIPSRGVGTPPPIGTRGSKKFVTML